MCLSRERRPLAWHRCLSLEVECFILLTVRKKNHRAPLLFVWAFRPRARHTPTWCRRPVAPLRATADHPRRASPLAVEGPCLAKTCSCEHALRLPDIYVPPRTPEQSPRVQAPTPAHNLRNDGHRRRGDGHIDSCARTRRAAGIDDVGEPHETSGVEWWSQGWWAPR